MPDFAARARAADAADPLAAFRSRFHLPDDVIYLDGNSLGALSHDAEAALLATIDVWKRQAIRGWTEAPTPWIQWAETLGARLAPLVGAAPETVLAAGSTTVNLHQLLATLYAPAADRTRILVDALAFPTDRYAVQSHLRLRGLDPAQHLVTFPSQDGYRLDENALAAALTPRIALAVLPSVVYTSGQRLDLARLCAQARRQGVITLWDLSHSVGAAPHALDEAGADAAFWCHYKWLNAGPGAVGGLYLNRRHHGKRPGLAGWFGARKDTLFDRAEEMTPAPGAAALQMGTTPVLALAPLAGALTVVEEAGLERLRAKSLAMTGLLQEMAQTRLARFGMHGITPHRDASRGGHLALAHPNAAGLSHALRQRGILPDHRPPDLLRLAPSPLYNTFGDCVRTMETLEELLVAGIDETPRNLVP